MNMVAAILLFSLLILALLALPFLPAWNELRRRSDVAPLPVSADGRVAVDFFAQRFRRFLDQQLSGPLAEVRGSGQILRGELEGHDPFVVLPTGARVSESDREAETSPLILSTSDLVLPSGDYRHEIYSEAGVEGADDIHLRALLAEGPARFGRNTCVERWLHGESELRFDSGARLHGRVSAAGTMHLNSDTRFFRLGAPLLLCGEDLTPHRDSTPETVAISHQDLAEVTCTAGGRVLVEGDLEIPAGRCFHGDLVVKGTLRFGAGAHLVGSAKADHLHMGRGARVDGALVAREELRLAAGVSVHGPALCEGDFHIAARCEVGSIEHPSTLRARRLTIDAPCRLHGSVWAQEEGVLR